MGATGVASAAANVWTTGGPEGGPVYRLAADPSNPLVLYAGTRRNGLFKTVNGGDRWFRIATNVVDPLIQAIVVDPSNGQKVYIATAQNGVFRSADGGATWSSGTEGMNNLPIGS
ncbi:MAG TPA: hypothetical protein VIY96_11010, partial [Thermoanaerobaculia bacterium]